MSQIILYYVQGPVHTRNAQLIATQMPEFTVRVVYEAEIPWFNPKTLAAVPFDTLALKRGRIPESLWEGDIQAVVLSAIQPRSGPLNLIRSALDRRVPTVAIEESNQLALNVDVISNINYLGPVDHVLVASEFERDFLVGLGVPGRRVRTTGWPFYAGRVGPVGREEKRASKRRFGFDPDRPVALLTLTTLGDAGEDAQTRRFQLLVAAQGLPADWQLAVKAHPAETNANLLAPVVSDSERKPTLIDSAVPISEVLAGSDVLLNRGISQVTIEALLQAIPVIVISPGHRSPFHDHVPEVVVQCSEDLARVAERLANDPSPMDLYASFMNEHVPHPPVEARRLTCEYLAKVAEEGLIDPDPASQWLDLALLQAWRVSASSALSSLSAFAVMRDARRLADALRDLVRRRAARDQLGELRQWAGSSFREDILRCLWIDQLHECREALTQDDLQWVGDFLPKKNAPFFWNHVCRWAHVLLRSGYHDRAEVIAQVAHHCFSYNPMMRDLHYWVQRYRSGPVGRAQYWGWYRWQQVRPRFAATQRRFSTALSSR